MCSSSALHPQISVNIICRDMNGATCQVFLEFMVPSY